MTDPLKLRIQKSMQETFSQITHANGFRSNVNAVYRGRIAIGDDEPLDAITLLEPPVPDDPIRGAPANTASSGIWEVLVQGFVEDDYENPTDPAYVLMTEVKMMLARERRRDDGFNMFGQDNKVSEILIGQGICRPPDELSVRAYFWLPVGIRITEDLLNPFA